MSLESLPDGWEVWSDEARKAVLVFRPDVFDTAAFPAPCLPTIYVTKGKRGRRPGRPDPAPDESWYVTLFFEPDVETDPETFDTRGGATAGASRLAERFAAGEIDYRSHYQVPRPAYFEKLDELTGATAED